MVPPTKIITEEDLQAMFIRRHIDISIGSRCCAHQMVDSRLSHEAFYSLVPYKNAIRSVSHENLRLILQCYREKVNSKKHLDFDDCFCLSDAELKMLTGFTRVQHDTILSYKPTTALKNLMTRSARSALAYLLIKLKLGLTDSVFGGNGWCRGQTTNEPYHRQCASGAR